MKKPIVYPHELILTGIHMHLSPANKAFIHDKVQKLIRHQFRIVRIRVDIEHVQERTRTGFVAKGSVEIHGPDIAATAFSPDCHKAIDLLVGKLDRVLAKRHSARKSDRNHPHGIDLAVGCLPKGI